MVGEEQDNQGADRGSQKTNSRPCRHFLFPMPGWSRKGQESGFPTPDWGRELGASMSMSHVFRGPAPLGAGHAGARLRLSPQYRLPLPAAGLLGPRLKLDALWASPRNARGSRLARTSRHPIWRPRHPRLRAVPAIGANGHDDAGAEARRGSTACVLQPSEVARMVIEAMDTETLP